MRFPAELTGEGMLPNALRKADDQQGLEKGSKLSQMAT